MLDINIGRHHFQAFPQRALYWPAQDCLLIADLHLGKADTFRRFGIAVPQAVQWSDLNRLSSLIHQLKPLRCLVLGDFVHGHTVNAATVDAWNTVVASAPHTQFELLLGNHDRALPSSILSLHAVNSDLVLDGVWLSHEPVPVQQLTQGYELNIHGHIHPAMHIDGSRSKLPALVHRSPYLMMPAFSEFTAGVAGYAMGDAVWVFAQDASLVMRVR